MRSSKCCGGKQCKTDSNARFVKKLSHRCCSSQKETKLGKQQTLQRIIIKSNWKPQSLTWIRQQHCLFLSVNSRSHRRMSELGQKRTSQQVRAMSALPPKADIDRGRRNVRFVPEVDVARTCHNVC